MTYVDVCVTIASGMADVSIKVLERLHSFRGALTFALFGVGSFLLGLFIIFVDPYHLLYQYKLKFGPGGEIFSLWEKPPVQLFLKVYLWNVTNSKEYMSGMDTKLEFQEVGPYVYRELMSHENVVFNENGTLSSVPSHPLVWDPLLSGDRKEDDLLILPNIALLSIADVVATKNMFTRLGLNVIIRQSNSQPLVQMTAKEFMFGYKSTLMDLGNTFMPSWIYFNKLGLIDRMYDFKGDYETIYTGTKLGMDNIGLVATYNGATKIPQWENPCGDIQNSSDGTKFPGNIKPNDTLRFFRKSMCRAKSLVRVGETVEDGFNSYVYHFDPESDDNGRVHPKNRCFCTASSIDQCHPKGLLDVKGCYYGFPIALSYPHFLDGDKVLFNKVKSGLNPQKEKHQSYVIIEPNSGTPIKLAIRYQINMFLGNLKNVANSEKFSDMTLPLLWTEIGMYRLPTFLRIRFKLYLYIIPLAQTCFMYALFLGSIFACTYSLHKFLASKRTEITKNSHWIEDDIILNIDKKLASYIPEKRLDVNSKEMEMFFNSLVIPLNTSVEEA
ncbi:scavenger receptor class B member 1-like isoform X2 [Euwallacea fornicatus]|uniref:scavenger receptor class B member 1-like isoform X2 n=1 Tax=Euwallacea fornicatus TaxID=995702 RepID=UPI00338D838C